MIRKIDSNIFSLTILKVTTFSRIRHIEDVDTKRKYFIQDSDIGIGKHQAQPHGNDWTYSETYPALPRTTRYINVFNGKVLSLKNYKLW